MLLQSLVTKLKNCCCSLLWRNSKLSLQSFVTELKNVTVVFCDRTQKLLLLSLCDRTQKCHCGLLWRNSKTVAAVFGDLTPSLKAFVLLKWCWTVRVRDIRARVVRFWLTAVRFPATSGKKNLRGQQVSEGAAVPRYHHEGHEGWRHRSGHYGRLRAGAPCVCNKNEPSLHGIPGRWR